MANKLTETSLKDETIPEGSRSREKRKKVYERKLESEIPEEIRNLFMKDGWALRPIRWSIHGVEDAQYLAKRENEGYIFVEKQELPDWYLRQLRIEDTRTRKGLVTFGDLCLMKVDADLQRSRQEYYEKEGQDSEQAVSRFIKNKGFRDLGTKNRVSMKEPTFRD